MGLSAVSGGLLEMKLEGFPEKDRQATKKHWRRKMSGLRRSLAQEDHRRWSQLTCSRLDVLLTTLGARSIGVYAPVKGETDIAGLWEVEKPGARSFYFPRISENHMNFHVVENPGEDLGPGALGIPAPSSDAPYKSSSAFEVVLVPGLAFDVFGGRVGFGAGYYDRLFGPLKIRPWLVGIGFMFQLGWDAPLPVNSYDVLMDWVVTNRECVRCLPCSYT